MDRIRIVGGQRLNGAIPISGAKNATLPLMIASLLTADTLILENVPRLAAALRENLRRRKAQERGRDAQAEGGGTGAAGKPASGDENP